ncbi:MAG: CDP-diacylglycerol--glycerol-3-phosphate 3-phosphatidyltransferase [marine bacterium B5-7]|nr:MAG: CDP-diacylglycerol--glycerol-3-phosphate 3-phosphatidyltransferase [marine bacterium B5-7]
MNIPNTLTVARILMIPFFVLAFYLPLPGHYWAAAFVFLLAAGTDWLDGFLARLLKQSSPFGEFLDPVADKLMVAVALVAIVGHFHGALLALPVAVIIAREITVSALREWMAEMGKRASVAVSWLSKLKTVLQMIAVTVLLLCAVPSLQGYYWIGLLLMYAAALLTLWTMAMYLKVAWPALQLD